MQEVVFLIHLVFTMLECTALVIGDATVVILGRLCSLSIVLVCHCLRQLNTSPLHSPQRSEYYTQLLYLFIALDLLAYLLTSLVLAISHASTRHFFFTASMGTLALARAYAEKPERHVDHVESRGIV
jgi:hypothetical protein